MNYPPFRSDTSSLATVRISCRSLSLLNAALPIWKIDLSTIEAPNFAAGKNVKAASPTVPNARAPRFRGTVSTGLGLGLAIVKSIAEIHHGYIKVQNRETGGTKFSLILPL